MPTAPGATGSWYQVWVSVELNSKIEQAAMKLYKKRKLRDENGHVVTLKQGPDGQYVPHYAVAKYALLQLVNGNPKKSQPTG